MNSNEIEGNEDEDKKNFHAKITSSRDLIPPEELTRDEAKLDNTENVIRDEAGEEYLQKIEKDNTFAENEAVKLSQEIVNDPEKLEKNFQGEKITEYLQTFKNLTSKENKEKFSESIRKIDENIKSKDYLAAIGNIKEYYTEIQNQLPQEHQKEVKKLLTDKTYQQELKVFLGEKIKHLSENGKLMKILSAGGDFIPIAGPAKMLLEAAKGKTLAGEELKGKNRLIHAVEGAVFLALDLTGGGIIASKIAKGTLSSGKILTRAAAFMKVSRVSAEIYKPVFAAGRMVIKNPLLFKSLNMFLAQVIKNRTTARVVKVIATT